MADTLKDSPEARYARWRQPLKAQYRRVLNRADRAYARMQTYRASIDLDYAPIQRRPFDPR